MRSSTVSLLKGSILCLDSVMWLQLPLSLHVLCLLKGMKVYDSGTDFHPYELRGREWNLWFDAVLLIMLGSWLRNSMSLLTELWAGLLGRYRDWATGWTVRDWIPLGDEIFRPSKTTLGPKQPPVKWVPGLSPGQSAAGVYSLTTHQPSCAAVLEE